MSPPCNAFFRNPCNLSPLLLLSLKHKPPLQLLQSPKRKCTPLRWAIVFGKLRANTIPLSRISSASIRWTQKNCAPENSSKSQKKMEPKIQVKELDPRLLDSKDGI